MFYIAPTRFASTIVMLKGFRSLKRGLQEVIISDEWSSEKEDDVARAQSVKEILLNDNWWMKVDYILAFTASIDDVLRKQIQIWLLFTYYMKCGIQ